MCNVVLFVTFALLSPCFRFNDIRILTKTNCFIDYSMKKTFALVLALVALVCSSASAATPLADRYGTFAVLGDSYSTFMGFTDPLENAQWYPHAGNAMASVEQTWWKLFERESGVELVHNNSFSGSTICTHSWNNSTDLVNSFVGRVDNLRKAGLIIVEGATNDNNAGSALGEYVWSGFTDAQKRTFRGGTAYVIDFLQKKYPESKVIFMLNNGLRSDINESVQVVCDHYNVPVLKLADITKIEDHPDVGGMEAICEQLMRMLCEMEGIRYISEGDKNTSVEPKDEARVLVNKPLAAEEWNAVCLPFSLTAEKIDAAFGEGTRVMGVESIDGLTVSLGGVGSIEANKPYLVMPGHDVAAPWLVEGVALVAPQAESVGDNVCAVEGTYTPLTARSGRTAHFTFAADGSMYNSSAASWRIKPLSVVVKVARTDTPVSAIDGYTPRTLPELDYDLAFTPSQWGHASRAAVPLIVADPFLSVWSHSEVLTDDVTKHVGGTTHPLEGYVEVDGRLYRFLGTESFDVVGRIAGWDAEAGVAVQKAVHVTPTQTYVTLEAAGVRFTVVFAAPQLVDDPTSLGAAVNYVSYQAEAVDGKAHEAKVHLSFSSSLVCRSSNAGCSVETDLSSGVAVGRMGLATQSMTEGVRPNWGYICVMADASRGQKITPNGSAHMIFSDDLGTVTDRARGYTVVGRDECGMAIGFGYARFPAPWTHEYTSFSRLLCAYASEVNERLAECRRFDNMIYDDAARCGSLAYADMCRASYRQVVGACKQAVSDTGVTLLYNFEAGGSGNISQADRMLATAPLLLAYGPELAYQLYASVPDYIRMFPGFSSPYGNAPHHLGVWPIMAGSHLDNGVDATTDICLLAASAVACGVDADTMDDYTYEYLLGLCRYLDLFTLPQYEANFANEGSVDGSIRDNANLRLKAILAMDGVAQIALARGRESDAALCSEMANRWEQIFRTGYLAGDHYRHGSSVAWGQKYPLFFRRLLEQERLADVETTELAYYASMTMGDYGMQLHGASSSIARVSATMLTGALTDSFDRWCGPVAAYFGTADDAAGESVSGGSFAPVADRYNCLTGAATSGAGSSALGALWGRVLLHRRGVSGVTVVTSDDVSVAARRGVYDLSGRRLAAPVSPGIYIVDGRKTVVR